MFNKLYQPSAGGIERAVYDLCEENKDKVELTVLSANTKFKTETEYRNGYKIIRAASFGKVLSSVHLAIAIPWWWKKIRADIVHFHFPSPVAELYCLALWPRRQPLVVSYHADIVGYKKALFFYNFFLRKFLERADRIIISSSAILEHSPFLDKFRDKCVIIPYGIDIDKFRLTEQVKEATKIIRDRFYGPIILFVGRLVAYKGLDYLIPAMKDIAATLLVVGKGNQEAVLKKLAKNLGVSKKVFFIGEVQDKDLPAYYHACDVFVLPSVNNKEEFGLVQLEAHTCAKPVVSTTLPTAVPFVNLDGITGITISPRSSKELVVAVNKLLGDEGLRIRLGKQAQDRAESQFNREIMAKKVLDVYREVFS